MSAEQVPSTINWIQLVFPAIGVSAAVGGIVSALVNYWMNRRVSRKKSEMSFIEEKVSLYAFLISRLDEMKYIDDALSSHHGIPQDPNSFSYPQEDWKQLIQEIDEKIRQWYYLMNRRIYERWVTAKTLYSSQESKKTFPELRQLLTDEYNQMLRKHLKHIKEDIISEISPDKPVLDFTQHTDNKDKDK